MVPPYPKFVKNSLTLLAKVQLSQCRENIAPVAVSESFPQPKRNTTCRPSKLSVLRLMQNRFTPHQIIVGAATAPGLSDNPHIT